MTTELRELYQEAILDHQAPPRNFGRLPAAGHTAEGYNPLCGDRVTIDLVLDADAVKDVRFEGSGCAISTASASMMTEHIKGMNREEVERCFQDFHRLLTSGSLDPALGTSELGKLRVFSGVRRFPVRIKCATLAWHALRAALTGREEPVTTE